MADVWGFIAAAGAIVMTFVTVIWQVIAMADAEVWHFIDKCLKWRQWWKTAGSKALLFTESLRQKTPKLVERLHPFLETIAETDQSVVITSYLAFFGGVWLLLIVSGREGLLSGFLVGLANGIGLIYAWAWMMERRQKQRLAKAADVNVLDARPASELKRVFAGDKPPGLSCTELDKVEWVNRLVRKVWPWAAAVVEGRRPEIREWLEPQLEDYRLGVYQVVGEFEVKQRVERYMPVEEVITALYVNDLDLGSVVPHIEGVKLRNLKEKRMNMDVRVRWRGDSRVSLGVASVDGILPVVLESLHVLATVRVVIHIAEEPPFLSALVVMHPADPKPLVEYSLKCDSDDFPTVLRKLRHYLDNLIFDTLLWPHRLVLVPTWAAKMDAGDLGLKLHGQLSVAVIKGDNLVNLYPYVLLYIRVKFKLRTKSFENTHNPMWNEEFVLDAEDQESQRLVLQVMDENKGPDQLLGMVTYPLARLTPDVDFELQLPVQLYSDTHEEERGFLTVELRYHVYTKEEQEAAMLAEKKLEGVLARPDQRGSYATALELIHP